MLFDPNTMPEFKDRKEGIMKHSSNTHAHHHGEHHGHHVHSGHMHHHHAESAHKHHGHHHNPLGFSHVGMAQAHGIKK